MFRKKRKNSLLLLKRRGRGRVKSKRVRNTFLRIWEQVRIFRFIQSLFRTSFLLFLFIIISVVLIIFAFFSPYFSIQAIHIERANPNMDISLLEKFLSNTYGENLLFVSTKDLTKDILVKFPEYESVSFKEEWPHSLKLTISLQKPAWLIFNQETAIFSVLSKGGIVLAAKPTKNLKNLKIYGYPQKLVIGTKWEGADNLPKIYKGYDLLQKEYGVLIKDIKFFPTAREVHYVRKKGGSFWVDLSGKPITDQLKKLTWGKKKINYKTDQFEYIDLRIPHQIFYK